MHRIGEQLYEPVCFEHLLHLRPGPRDEFLLVLLHRPYSKASGDTRSRVAIQSIQPVALRHVHCVSQRVMLAVYRRRDHWQVGRRLRRAQGLGQIQLLLELGKERTRCIDSLRTRARGRGLQRALEPHDRLLFIRRQYCAEVSMTPSYAGMLGRLWLETFDELLKILVFTGAKTPFVQHRELHAGRCICPGGLLGVHIRRILSEPRHATGLECWHNERCVRCVWLQMPWAHEAAYDPIRVRVVGLRQGQQELFEIRRRRE